MQYIIVKDSTVVQVIEWDGVTPYNFDEGVTYEENDYAGIGWVFDPATNKYINPLDGMFDESRATPLPLDPTQTP